MHLGTILKVLIATIVLYQKPMQISQKKIAEWNSKKDFFLHNWRSSTKGTTKGKLVGKYS